MPLQETKGQCNKCGEKMSFLSPTTDIVNEEKFSMIVVLHVNAVVCTKCGTSYQFICQGIKGLTGAWIPFEPDQTEGKIIVPGGGV